MFTDLTSLSSVELRLELAEAEAMKPQTIVAQCRRKNRIEAITNELVKRGDF